MANASLCRLEMTWRHILPSLEENSPWFLHTCNEQWYQRAKPIETHWLRTLNNECQAKFRVTNFDWFLQVNRALGFPHEIKELRFSCIKMHWLTETDLPSANMGCWHWRIHSCWHAKLVEHLSQRTFQGSPEQKNTSFHQNQKWGHYGQYIEGTVDTWSLDKFQTPLILS